MMAHSCPTCGQACYCDLDDTWMEGMEDQDACQHDCELSSDDEED